MIMIDKTNKHNSWYITKFAKQYEELLRLRDVTSGEKRQKIEDTLYIVQAMMFDPYKESTYFKAPLKEKLKYEKSELSTLMEFVHIIVLLWSTQTIDSRPKYIYSPKLSDEELFDLVYSFFKSCVDKDLFESFRSMYKRRDKLVHMSWLMERDMCPNALYLPYGNEGHIRLKREYTIEDAVDLAHEYGHIMHIQRNFSLGMYRPDFLFNEIVSTFFEILILEHLSHLNGLEQIAKQRSMENFDDAITKTRYIIIEDNLIELWDFLKTAKRKNIIETLDKECAKYFSSKKDIGVAYLLDKHMSSHFIYLIGFAYAVEILARYKEDRGWGLYVLKELIKIDCNLYNEEYYKELVRLGLEPCEHIEEYKTHLMKPIKEK